LTFSKKEFTSVRVSFQIFEEIDNCAIEHSLKAKYDYWDFSERRGGDRYCTTFYDEHSSLRESRERRLSSLLSLALSPPISSSLTISPKNVRGTGITVLLCQYAEYGCVW
jgi:hypothetical protein